MQEYSFIPDPEDRILSDFWYEQLEDPPMPPPKEDIIVVVDLTDYSPIQQTIQPPFPSGEGLGEALPLSI